MHGIVVDPAPEAASSLYRGQVHTGGPGIKGLAVLVL
jgi:hypothetical protein